MQKNKIMTALVVAAAASSLFVGTVAPAFADDRSHRTVNGALIGGALGAIVTHGSLKGALVGAAAGGIIGNVTTPHHHYHHYRRHYYRHY